MQASLLNEQATSALREQFIAVLGHDLRNPLASISAGIELLRRTPLNEKAERLAEMVEISVARMAGLIENVMDFARGRLGGGLTLDRSLENSLEPMVRHIVEELQISASDHVIESYFAIQPMLIVIAAASDSWPQIYWPTRSPTVVQKDRSRSVRRHRMGGLNFPSAMAASQFRRKQ